MDNNKLNANELAELSDTPHTATYHANHEIADKVIDKKSINFGKKGSSYMLMTEGEEQWYFKPKMKVPEFIIDENGDEIETGKMIDNKDYFRMKWWQLDSNVSEGSYGEAIYNGLNTYFGGKVGELFYTNKKWVFQFTVDGQVEKLNLVNPDSVTLVS